MTFLTTWSSCLIGQKKAKARKKSEANYKVRVLQRSSGGNAGLREVL